MPKITLNETTYELHDLAEADYGALDKWVRDRHIQLAEGKGQQVIDRALLQAASMTHEFGGGFNHIISIDGMGQLVWRHMSHEDRQRITPEAISKILREKSVLATVNISLNQLRGTSGKKKASGQENQTNANTLNDDQKSEGDASDTTESDPSNSKEPTRST